MANSLGWDSQNMKQEIEHLKNTQKYFPMFRDVLWEFCNEGCHNNI